MQSKVTTRNGLDFQKETWMFAGLMKTASQMNFSKEWNNWILKCILALRILQHTNVLLWSPFQRLCHSQRSYHQPCGSTLLEKQKMSKQNQGHWPSVSWGYSECYYWCTWADTDHWWWTIPREENTDFRWQILLSTGTCNCRRNNFDNKKWP